MKKKLFLAVLFCAAMVGFTVKAADIVIPEKGGSDVNIGSNQAYNDLYTAGANVSLSGKVNGDLTAGGGMVTVNGEVTQDALVGGGTIYLNGNVGDNARLAGGNITINAPINNDLAVAGGIITVTDKSSIGGDLLVAAGNLTLNAPVSGSVRIAGGSVVINSRIDGNMSITAKRLVFGPNAEVTGRVTYKGPQEAVVQSGAKVNNLEYIKYQPEKRHLGGIITAAFFVRLFAWIIAALVLSWLFRGFVLSTAERTFRFPWKNLGIGIITLIIVPIIAFLLLLTFVGYYLAVLLMLAYILLIAVSLIVAAVALGYLILRFLVKPVEVIYWQAIIIGVVVWSLLRLVPIAGWIITAIIFLMVFGELSGRLWAGVAPRKEEKAQP